VSPVRLLATDLDGTLLRSDGTVSERTRAALRAATDTGLLVAFVTGRPPRWLDEVIETTGHLGVAVGANGAVLYDMARASVLQAHYLEPDALARVAETLRAQFPDVQFAAERGDRFAAEPGYVHDWAINPRTDRRGRAMPPPLVGPLDEVISRPAVKLLAKDRGADADEFLLQAESLVGSMASLTHSSSFGLLEIGAFGVTKASGLAELAASHGIGPDEVVAIGDMPNDVPMLRWAGRAYAVANAHDAVREAADEVVASNDDDAVAALIESLLQP
jgi:Cof subfamily protein (haloacid dehalogenase superfamily)